MATDQTTGKRVPRKPLTDTERDEIVRLTLEKEPITSIAERLECSAAAVYRTLARRGITPPWKAERFTEDQKEEMCRMALSGTLVKDLATHFGCTTSNISHILRKRNVHVPHPLYRLTDDQKSDICRLYQAGESVRGLMARFDTDRTGIHRYLAQGGVALRPRIKRERKTPEHKCIHCGDALRSCEPHRRRCRECALRAGRMKEERRRHRAVAAGNCPQCGQPNDQGKWLCSACRNRNYRQRQDVKRRCMTGYGGRCACCGETELSFLTLDHVNDDGAEMRRSKTHGGSGTGENIYRWAIRNSYPDCLQCLCMNCQWGKRLNGGICPHQSATSVFDPFIFPA